MKRYSELASKTGKKGRGKEGGGGRMESHAGRQCDVCHPCGGPA